MESERQRMNIELCYCAKNGYEKILEDHAPQYDTDKFFRSRTLLENNIIHIAARYGNLSFVEKALALYPGLICEQNSIGDTPLHVAARFGHLEVVQAIVESYGTLSSKADHEASTPTDISTSIVINVGEITGRVAGDKLLPPWNIMNKEGSTALHEALMNGQEKVAMYLLDQDPYLARRVNQANESPLFLAAESGCNQIMEKILGGPEGSYSTDGPFDRNPLHAMALSFNEGVYVTEAGGGVVIKAAKTEAAPNLLVDRLLERDAGLVIRADFFGRTPLHYAAAQDLWSLSVLLLLKSLNPAYMRDKEGLTPLLLAAKGGACDTAMLILEHCPDSIDLLDNDGQHALHIAVEHAGDDLDKFLGIPEFRVLINKADNKGNTPLHLAVKNKHYEAITKLLETKLLDLGAKNGEGMKPLDLADPEFHIAFSKSYLKNIIQSQITDPSVRPKPGHLRQEAVRWAIPPSRKIIPSEKRRSLQETTNSLILVATLLATLTFATAFTIPGGYSPSGDAVLAKKPGFQIFLLSDIIAAAFSIAVVFNLIWKQDNYQFLYKRMKFSVKLLQISMVATIFAFTSGLYLVVYRETLRLAIGICILHVTLALIFVFLYVRADHKYIRNMLSSLRDFIFSCVR